MIYTFLLAIILIYLTAKKFKLWSPVFIFSIFIFLQILLYYLFINSLVPENAYHMLPIPYDLIGIKKTKTLIFYSSIMFFTLVLVFFNKKEYYQASKEDLKVIENLFNIIPRKPLTLFSFLFLTWTFIYAIYINWTVILKHNEYLAATSANKLDLNNIFSLVYNNSLLFIMSFALFGYSFCLKKKFNLEKNIFLIISLFIFIILLSRGSRSVLLMILIYAFCEILILEKKFKVWKIIIYALISIQLFTVSISIRGADAGGLLNIVPNIFDITNFSILDKLFFMYQNIFFGVLNFDIGLNYSPDFSTIHKFLSNSPLLSVIDGFREISQEGIYRITVYAPFNSYIEAYHFGIFFLIYFSILQIFNIYLVSSKLNTPNFIYYLPSTIFSYLSIIYATQYSVRTTTKFIFLSYLFIFVADYYLKKFAKKTLNK